MINQSFLTIKEPCHQDWENMSVSEKGRFCSSCKKHVHDFTNSTIEAAKLVLVESTSGVCGRFDARLLKEQLIEKRIKSLNSSFIRKFSFAVLFCFGANLFTVDSVQANELEKIKSSFFSKLVVANDSIIIKGIVKEKGTKEILPFSSVYVYSGVALIGRAEANLEGIYSVKISSEYSKIDIKAVFIGYTPVYIKDLVVTKGKSTELNIDLEMDEQIFMGDYIIEEVLPEKLTIEPDGKVIIKPE